MAPLGTGAVLLAFPVVLLLGRRFVVRFVLPLVRLLCLGDPGPRHSRPA